MKKKLFASVVLALVLVAVMAVPALAAAPTVTVSNTAPAAGTDVTFTISVTDYGIQGNVTPSANLTFKSASTNASAAAMVNQADAAGFLSMDLTTITYVYTVAANAAVGDTVSLTLSGLRGSTADAQPAPGSPYAGSVVAEATVAAAGEEATPTPTPTAPGTTPTPTATPGQDNVPKTADSTTGTWMLALLGLVALGGVGLFAAKKVFSR